MKTFFDKLRNRAFNKRLILMLLLMTLMTLNVWAASQSLSMGNLGNVLRWEFTAETGILEIRNSEPLGDGEEMPDFSRITDQPWRSYASDIKKVKIGYGITSVGRLNFHSLFNLESVEIVQNIGSISSTKLTKIGGLAFNGCGYLNDIGHLLDNVTEIGLSAFTYCRELSSINAPKVETIGNLAFFDCTGLTSAQFDSSLKTIEGSAFSGCSSLETIDISSGVTSIGESAFQNCSSLTSLVVPSGVTVINASTFSGCSSLSSLTLPTGITSIGANAFEGCSSLTSLEVPSGVTVINASTFSGCSSLSSLTLPAGITSIGANAFEGCSSLTSLVVPSGVTVINASTFSGCSSLSSLTLPTGITSIGANAFEGCAALTSFTLPSKVTTISSGLFKGCTKLGTLTLHDGITTIGASAFEGCVKITEFGIPSKITAIGDATFKGCTGLTSMTFSDKITSIGASAFNGCTGLTEMTVERTTPPTVGSNAFAGVNKAIPLHIPDRTLLVYQAANGWKDFTNMLTPSLDYVLDDATAHTETTDLLCNTLTYNRTFSATQAGKWQSLFVPFDIEITEDVLGKCDIAKPYMVATEGSTDGNVHDDDCGDVVVLKKLKEGDTAKHGTAYFIRPKEAGEFSLVLEDATVYACTDVNTLTCSTTEDNYEFIGQYASGKPASGATWYALAGGGLQLGDEGSPNLSAQRWYLTKTSKSGAPANAPARAIRLATWGEDDSTGISAILTDETEANSAVYGISGVRLSHPQKGLNIVNGRKVFIK